MESSRILKGNPRDLGMLFEIVGFVFFGVATIGLLQEGNYVVAVILGITAWALGDSLRGRLRGSRIVVSSESIVFELKGEISHIQRCDIESIFEGCELPRPDGSTKTLQDGATLIGAWAAKTTIEYLIGSYDFVLKKKSGEFISLNFTGTGIKKIQLKRFLLDAGLPVCMWKA